MGSNHIVHKQSSVTSGLLCTTVTKEFPHLRQLQRPLDLQGNGVVDKSGNGCKYG